MSWFSDIFGTQTDDQYNAMIKSANDDATARKNFATEPLPTMPTTPSFTDIVGSLYQQKKSRQGSMGYGTRGSTFLTGPLGDTSQAPIGTKSLLGG